MNSQVQETRLQQKLTPQQIMLTKLLQMPIAVLEQAVKSEVERNVMLEEASNHKDLESIEGNEHGDMAESNDHGGGDDYDDDDYAYRRQLEHDRNEGSRERVYVDEPSMMEQLIAQVELKGLNDRQREIAYELIGSLDNSGYLSRGLELIENDLILRNDLETNQQELEEVLKIIQSVEPAGVGARTLQECLLLQLERKGRCEVVENATEIVKNQFDDFAKRNYTTIANRLHLSDEAMNEAIAYIKKLNPKPCDGSTDEEQHGQYIIPDFVVRLHDDKLQCTQNDRSLPKLRISEAYASMMKEWSEMDKPSSGNKEALSFLKEQNTAAQNYIDVLDQRHATLQHTMNAIIKAQKKFFVTGEPTDMKPLSQKDLAAQIGLDDSTISRVVNSKYVQTDWGTFPLKHFFAQGMTNESGEEVSVTAIKTLLKEVIDGEDKQNPLTDDQLVEELKAKGVKIARRTVAKYRGQMGIQAGKLRRELVSLVVFMLLGLGGLMAQTPMSYYDSIIYAQQHPEKTKGGASKATCPVKFIGEKNGKVDTARLRGEDLKNIEYAPDVMALPALMWYGTNFSSNRVKLETFTIDSLPDEVNLKLINKPEEFCFPNKNIITSPYGWRWNRAHRGVDIRLRMGDPVFCAFPGVVRVARPMGAYGNVVVVRHHNGLETVYGHLSMIKVKPKQVVDAGDVLGLGGSTGRSTGPHLHFEVRFQYEPFDPEWILDFNNYTLRTRKLHLDKTYFGISKPCKNKAVDYKADKSYVKERTPQKPKPLYYRIRQGDKLDDVCRIYNTTPEHIKELNPDMKRWAAGRSIRVR